MVAKTKKKSKVQKLATGGAPNAPQTTAQGLPKPAPVGGFTPGPESNQAGSWGAAVEAGGIPGSTQGLQLSGNNPGPFNPGDQVVSQGLPAPAPNVASTYVAPTPPPSAPVTSTYNYYAPPAASSATTPVNVYVPPAPTPAPQAAPANPLSGPGGSYPSLATQTNSGVEFGFKRGGAIPAYDDGGGVSTSNFVDPSQGQEGQAGDSMSGVHNALNMTKQSFGLDPGSVGAVGPQGAPPPGGVVNTGPGSGMTPIPPAAMIARGGAIPTYDEGGMADIPPDQGQGFAAPQQQTQAPEIPQGAPDQQQGQEGLMQKAIRYFSGAGAMAQDQFNALKARVLGNNADQMSPTQQNMAVLNAAAKMGPEVATGAVQHLKSQYEPRRMQAARALESGHTDVGAQLASEAMNFVPDDHEMTFMPRGRDAVQIIAQNPAGSVGKATIPAVQLAQLLKSPEYIWDKVTTGGDLLKKVFQNTPVGGADQTNPMTGETNEPAMAPRALFTPTPNEKVDIGPTPTAQNQAGAEMPGARNPNELSPQQARGAESFAKPGEGVMTQPTQAQMGPYRKSPAQIQQERLDNIQLDPGTAAHVLQYQQNLQRPQAQPRSETRQSMAPEDIYLRAYTSNLQQGQSHEDAKANAEDAVRAAVQQHAPKGAAPVTLGGNDNAPTLRDPAEVAKLPANVPFFRDPNNVLRRNPNYRGQ